MHSRISLHFESCLDDNAVERFIFLRRNRSRVSFVFLSRSFATVLFEVFMKYFGALI